MAQEQTQPLSTEKKQKLVAVFERLLPLVDSVADKFRFVTILGLLATVWLVTWFFHFKHFSIGVTAAVGIAALLPTLVLARFWRALEELKGLPNIVGKMAGDAKSELQKSVQNIRAGNIPKLGFFSAGRSLWSIGAMASEARELVGSYIGIATLANPFMLILGAVSLAGVLLLALTSIVLAFFAF